MESNPNCKRCGAVLEWDGFSELWKCMMCELGVSDPFE